MTRELVKVERRDNDLAMQFVRATSNPEARSFIKWGRQKASIIRGFISWVGKPPSEVTRADIEDYRSELEALGRSKSSQYNRICTLSRFFSWLEEQGLVEANPVPGSEWRRSFRPEPYSSKKTRALSPQEVQRFLEAIPDTMQGARLRAMVLLALTTGARSSEVCGILWEDVRLANDPPLVMMKTKGGRWVEYELTPLVVEAIREYLRVAERRPRRGHGLFCPVTRRKKKGQRYQPVDPFYFYSQVRGVGEKAGLGRISPHTFRHTFAQLLNGQGWSVPEIQGSLGHKSSQTTRIYLDRLSPRSSRAGKVIQGVLGLDEG